MGRTSFNFIFGMDKGEAEDGFVMCIQKQDKGMGDAFERQGGFLRDSQERQTIPSLDVDAHLYGPGSDRLQNCLQAVCMLFLGSNVGNSTVFGLTTVPLQWKGIARQRIRFLRSKLSV